MIYFDHAATTPVDARVLQKMMPYFSEHFGNPNSQHAAGRFAAAAVDAARDTVASILGAKPGEIYFTSGGTESDNWALRGAAHACANRGRHIIVSAVEHAAVISAAKELQREGFDITFAAVDAFGRVDVEELRKSIRPDTTLIGVMTANNEIGTLQPIGEISALARERGILLFTDAVQAAGAMELNVNAPSVDLLSLSGHKFYGPKGVGVLYIRSGLRMDKLIAGGHQERAMRGGTTNVAGVVGLAEAFRLASEEMPRNNAHICALRDYFIGRVLKEIPHVRLNGHPKDRLPNNANFSFSSIEGESILYSLDLAGIAVSGGAACSSGSIEPSHVLLATGLSAQEARGAVRFSFGKENQMQEVDFAVEKLKEIVERLRKLALHKSS